MLRSIMQIDPYFITALHAHSYPASPVTHLKNLTQPRSKLLNQVARSLCSPLAQVSTQKRCAVVLESKAGYGPRTQISRRALLQPERSLYYVSAPQFLVG